MLSTNRYDDTVTFHVIFQGQYLPAGFNWNTIAQYYESIGNQKVAQLEDSATVSTASVNEISNDDDEEDETTEKRTSSRREPSGVETKRRRVVEDSD